MGEGWATERHSMGQCLSRRQHAGVRRLFFDRGARHLGVEARAACRLRLLGTGEDQRRFSMDASEILPRLRLSRNIAGQRAPPTARRVWPLAPLAGWVVDLAYQRRQS